MRTMIAMLLVLTVATGNVLAQTGGAADDHAGRIAPFVEDSVILVMAFDFKRIDVDVALGQLAKVLPPHQVAKAGRQIRSITGTLTAAGARRLYLAVSLNDVIGPRVFTFLVPLAKGSDADALAKLLGGPNDNWKTADVLVVGPPETVARVRDAERKPRPEVTAALAAGGETAFRLVIVPTADTRRALAETMPELPPSLGGGPVDPIVHGLRWASLAVDITPKLSVKVKIQCADEASARALLLILKRTLDSARKDEEVRKILPNIGEIIPLVMPRLEGTALTLTLDDKQTDAVTEKLIAAPMRRAQDAARRVSSMQNIRMIVTASHMYARDHKGEWPDNLQALLDRGFLARLVPSQDVALTLEAQRRILQNRRDPQRAVGYVYIKPSKEDAAKGKSDVVVIYEAYDVWPEGGINVGFVDGHVQRIVDEARFRKRLRLEPKAQVEAAMSRAVAGVRRLMLACLQYARDHRAEWPDDLKALRDGKYLTTDKVFHNPRQPKRRVGYVYIKPSKEGLDKRRHEIIVIHEAYDVWPDGGIAVAFADGHVMLVPDEPTFKKHLANRRN